MTALSQDDIEKIKKWQVTSALRGVSLFDNEDDDNAVYEHVLNLSEIQTLRESRDKLFRCAEEFVNLGFTDDQYMSYQSMADELRLAKYLNNWQHEVDNNSVVKKLRNDNKFIEVTGRGKTPRYFKAEVTTEQHGILNIKGRVVPERGYWPGLKIVWETSLPNGEKIKKIETASKNSLLSEMVLGLPTEWALSRYSRAWSSAGTEKEETFLIIAARVVDQVETLYKTPMVKKPRARRKTSV